MFVRYFLELSLPHEDVEAALLNAPQAWIPGLAEDADARGQSLLAEVGFGPTGWRVGKRVQIELGEPVQLPSKAVLPMRWRPFGAEALFPSLDADIEVAALGRGLTQLSVSAQYRPPLGKVGQAIDRVLLHRVAEATIKDFTDRVGKSIQSKIGTVQVAERRPAV